jgi:hypothetical protein
MRAGVDSDRSYSRGRGTERRGGTSHAV